jgi:hypothetical protein
MEIRNQALPFIDILLTLEHCMIKTDIYHKPTDTHNYLPFNSAHPNSTKINLPYNLARRVVMLVDEKEAKDIHFAVLHEQLKVKGYPSAVINSGITKALNHSKQDLLIKKQDKSKTKTLSWVHDYNPNNPTLTGMIKSTVDNLSKSDNLQGAFKNTKVIVAKRQPPNLKQLLTRAAFKTGLDTFTVKNAKEIAQPIKFSKKVHHTFSRKRILPFT